MSSRNNVIFAGDTAKGKFDGSKKEGRILSCQAILDSRFPSHQSAKKRLAAGDKVTGEWPEISDS